MVLEYGLDEGDLDQIQERAPSFWERLLSDRKLYLDLVDSFIRDMAEKENFILLGRGDSVSSRIFRMRSTSDSSPLKKPVCHGRLRCWDPIVNTLLNH